MLQNVFTDLQVSKPPVLVPDTYVCEVNHGRMELVSPARLLYAGLSLDYSSVLGWVYHSYNVCWNQMVDESLVRPAESDFYFCFNVSEASVAGF